MPSQMTITSATSQPSIACGPPSAVMSSGIVMNGPDADHVGHVQRRRLQEAEPARQGWGGHVGRQAEET